MKIAALLFAAAATAFAPVPAADLRWMHTTPQVVNVRNFQPAGGTIERQLIVTINGQATQSHVIIHGTNIR